MKRILISALLLAGLSLSSCDKYLDVEPVGRVLPKTTEDYRGLLTSAYSYFPQHKSLLALRTDELILNDFSEQFVYNRDIYFWKDTDFDPVTTPFPYQFFYQVVFYTNNIIASAEADAGKSVEVDQIVGEAYLLRAYSHFELLNLFAKPYNTATAATDRGVPISTEIDLEQDYKPASVEAVYEQIFKDIEAGEPRLSVNSYELGKNYRFTRRAALALKARIHLYRSEWKKSLDAAQKALDMDSRLEDFNLTDSKLPNHFQSVESVMSLEHTFPTSVSGSVYISPDFINRYAENKDLRRTRFFRRSGSRYSSIKGGEEFVVSFRNAELYLTKAEAAYHESNEPLAKETLLALKAKRLTPDFYSTESVRINALSGAALLNEILEERALELALEGHRWYDLRRNGQPQIIHTYDGEQYILRQNDPRYTLPFPREAVSLNPDLR
ncbi:RagB/SusD family nutrient uptake outer membrane protein [Desertivirga xinjiangensis]|uniref:RagB/SusD family nutrient uptake outer membrane protein n=1 Tax=Desertivirga xinjiangensis TaxID=539206 RepID=UPI00210A2ED0|nr:RagB/SusD family nutrient uptake outer membrane protein [Pedobacter xinjiangensis]